MWFISGLGWTGVFSLQHLSAIECVKLYTKRKLKGEFDLIDK